MEIYSGYINQQQPPAGPSPYPGMTYPWQWWRFMFPPQPGMSPWTIPGMPGYPGYPGSQQGGVSPGFPGMGWPWPMMPSPCGQQVWPFSWTQGWGETHDCRGCLAGYPYSHWAPWTMWWGTPPAAAEIPGGWQATGEPTAPTVSPYSAREAGTEQQRFDFVGVPLWESMESPESPWIQMPKRGDGGTGEPMEDENG